MTACTLPALSPRTNGDLQDALETAKGAWAICAAKVDMIVTCQAEGLPSLDKAEPRHD